MKIRAYALLIATSLLATPVAVSAQTEANSVVDTMTTFRGVCLASSAWPACSASSARTMTALTARKRLIVADR